MYVRMKVGAYAGEIREVKYHVGVDLVRDGKAEKVSFDPENPSPPPAVEIAITPDVAEMAKQVPAEKKPAPKKGKK